MLMPTSRSYCWDVMIQANKIHMRSATAIEIQQLLLLLFLLTCKPRLREGKRLARSHTVTRGQRPLVPPALGLSLGSFIPRYSLFSVWNFSGAESRGVEGRVTSWYLGSLHLC